LQADLAPAKRRRGSVRQPRRNRCDLRARHDSGWAVRVSAQFV